MTSREIAIDAITAIAINCDIARPFVIWSDSAEREIISAFQCATDSNKSVTAVSNQLLKCSLEIGGKSFSSGISCATYNALSWWYCNGFVKNNEEKMVLKMLDIQ